MKRREFIDEKMAMLESYCRDQGMALTVQRRTILETLAKHTDHPTADQLYEEVKGVIRGVSRTTVYRVLETFVQRGVVIKVSKPGAKARFDADTGRHHHLICLGCDAVVDCHDERLQGIEVPNEVASGFEVRSFSLAITGFCEKCRRQTAP
jgi:Fur family peroxide stress response transcriptional regulator